MPRKGGRGVSFYLVHLQDFPLPLSASSMSLFYTNLPSLPPPKLSSVTWIRRNALMHYFFFVALILLYISYDLGKQGGCSDVTIFKHLEFQMQDIILFSKYFSSLKRCPIAPCGMPATQDNCYEWSIYSCESWTVMMQFTVSTRTDQLPHTHTHILLLNFQFTV